MTILYYVLGLLGGAASALQGTVNGRLGTLVKPANAAVLSTAVAFVSLIAYAASTRQLDVKQAVGAPPVLLIGGMLGAFFVTSVIYVVPRLGVVAAVLLAIVGQLAVAILADQFGLFGNPKVELSLVRALGIALVVVGFVLARV